MIGLVITKPAVVTVAGVTPLSAWYVWRIKLRMLATEPVYILCGLAGILALAAPLVGFLVHEHIGTTAIALVFGYQCVREARWIQRHPNRRALWRTAPLSFDGAYYGCYFVSVYGYIHPVPAEARQIGEAVQALGLAPQIEYFDEDPFLFVEVLGRRVYLYHWDV